MRLKTIATFGLGKIGGSSESCVSLNIVQGSVIDFKAPSTEKCTDNSNEKPDKQKHSQPPLSGISAFVAKAATERSEKQSPPDAVKDPPMGKIASLVAKTKNTSAMPVHDANARVGAIVNAANERCLGGGGVDGAINNAGGLRLWKDREALPLLSTDEVRCHTGRAVVTGPNRYGSLHVNYVIHAVGPIYFRYSKDSEEEDPEDTFTEPDSLLRSAYQESLERCQENGITDVAFSLLSAGVYRGSRSLHDVLRIGVLAIRDWVAEAEKTDFEPSGDEIQASASRRLQSVTLCGFSEPEVEALVKVCQLVFGKEEEEQK